MPTEAYAHGGLCPLIKRPPHITEKGYIQRFSSVVRYAPSPMPTEPYAHVGRGLPHLSLERLYVFAISPVRVQPVRKEPQKVA